MGQSYQFLHPAADVLRVGRPPDALQELRQPKISGGRNAFCQNIEQKEFGLCHKMLEIDYSGLLPNLLLVRADPIPPEAQFAAQHTLRQFLVAQAQSALRNLESFVIQHQIKTTACIVYIMLVVPPFLLWVRILVIMTLHLGWGR